MSRYQARNSTEREPTMARAVGVLAITVVCWVYLVAMVAFSCPVLLKLARELCGC